MLRQLEEDSLTKVNDRLILAKDLLENVTKEIGIKKF